MNKRINFSLLDGLRGLAAFYVLLGHCRGKLLIGGNQFAESVPIDQWTLGDKLYYGSLQLTSLSREFVILFFVLSGFSIAYSLTRQTNLIDFYKKRLVRLYPPYILALLWAFVIFYFYNDYWHYIGDEHSVFGTWQRTISNLFYVPDGEFIPQFWSLTFEVLFYLIAPFLLVQLGTRKFYLWFSLIIYAASLVYSPWQTTSENIFLGFLLDYNVYFAFGVFTFWNLERLEKFSFFGTKRNSWLLLLAIPVLIATNYKLGFYTKTNLLLSALVSVALIVFVLKYEMKNRLLIWMGQFSYTLYITHYASLFFFIILLRHFIPELSLPFNNWYLWLLSLPFCVFIAWLLYFMAEAPSKKYLDRLRINKKKQA